MIIGARQISFSCANVPPIQHQDNTDIDGYEDVISVFEEALMQKQCYYYKHKEFRKEKLYQVVIGQERKMYNDCLRQTVNFLKSIKALKGAKKINQIELWHKSIPMQPFYEGINAQLKSMLIKFHCPSMHAAISKGAVYSHQTLTDIGESVSYLMEYFTKEGLLNNQDEVATNSEVKKWINNELG